MIGPPSPSSQDRALPLWAADLSAAAICQQFDTHGVVVLQNVFGPEDIAALKLAVTAAIAGDVQVFGQGSMNYRGYGVVVSMFHYAMAHPILFSALLHQAYIRPFEALLGEDMILYTSNNVSTPPQGSTFALALHRDQRVLTPGFRLRVVGMVLLDDFTLENGATYFLLGSQHQEQMPAEDYFYAHAHRLLAPRGSVCYFNPSIWHAAGLNQTDSWRHTYINTFTPFWAKQRLDLPRLLTAQGFDPTGQPAALLRRLGYYHQVPTSYAEFQMPIAERLAAYAQQAQASGGGIKRR